MAINDIVQTIAEARVDARSLSEFVFKPAGFKVARRLAPTVDTLQFYINRFNSLNGDFSSSVSVALSSLNNSVAEAQGKVAYIENTVQDAINNTAVEGGILADTFVTVTTRSEGQVARTQSSKNMDTVNARDYGASTNKPDNATSINTAALVAASTGSTLTISETYPCTSVVTIPANVHVIGSSYETCGITNNTSASTVSIAGGGVVFQGVAILNGSTSRRSVTCEDFDAPVFKSCNINGRIYCRNSSLVLLKAPQFIDCNIDCDFGNDYDGVSQSDVFSIYGFGYPVWHNCDIKVANVHRIWKFSQGLGEPIDTGVVGNTNVKMAIINKCRISGYGGKQGIDSFYGTQSIIFTNNHLDISGQTGLAGNKFTNFIEGKTATSYNGVKGQGINVLVQGNTGRLGCDFISIQGSYGLIKDGHISNRYDTVKIINNTLERTETSLDAFVAVRLCHSVYSDGNTYNVLCETNIPSVDYSSNKTLTVGNSDVYEGGYLRLFKAVNNSGGDSFSGIADTINIGSISILDFDATAAIQLGALNCRTLKIGAVNAVTVDSPVSSCRAIRTINTEYIGKFDISGFEILHKGGGTVTPIIDAVASNNLTVKDCSWLPRFRGYVTELPTTGTYLKGDTLKRQNPSSISTSSWVCTAGNDTGGLWRMDGQIVNRLSTASRPSLTATDIGFMYLDTTLATAGKPIWWTGVQWVDSVGTVV